MGCSNCSKGTLLLVIVILLLIAIIPFRFGNTRVNIPRRLNEKIFQEFIKRYNRSYGQNPGEYDKRYNIFAVSGNFFFFQKQ